MSNMLKSLAFKLPMPIQSELRRYHFARQIRAGTFVPDEPEIKRISELLVNGDVAVDVGANVGHYTVHLSKCVGMQGRVLAFEPVAETFEILSHNVCKLKNVTLINAAVAETASFVSMDVPTGEEGGKNFYRARIHENGTNRVLCLRLDSLELPKVTLIKVDAEGHDLGVLKSAERLIARDRPYIVVEASTDSDVASWLRARDYSVEHAAGSPNLVAVPNAR